jgi:hypothetical protein
MRKGSECSASVMAKTSFPEAVPMSELCLIFEGGEPCFCGLWLNAHSPKTISGNCQALKLRFNESGKSQSLFRPA